MSLIRKVLSKEFLLICISVINLHKLFLSVQISTFNEIYDPDLINYYEPVAKSLPSNYISLNDPLSGLYAQVTPIFPIFIRLFQNRSQAIVANVMLSFLVLFLVYLIATKMVSKYWSLFSVFLLSLEPSFYASSLNLAPEMIYSTTLVLGVYFLACKPFKKQIINITFFSFLIGISILIRPIALILILSLVVINFIFVLGHRKVKWTRILIPTIFLTLPTISWSVKNYINYGFFGPSSISASNFFWYQGVPALANAEGLSFEDAVAIELERRSILLGDKPSVLENYTYNNKRGLELVFQYPQGAIISYIKGIPKIILGIFKSKFTVILNNAYKIDNETFIGIIFIILGVIVLFTWLLFIYGIHQLYRKNLIIFAIFIILIACTLIPASGHIAYARFRSPIMPFVCIASVVGFSELRRGYLNRTGQDKRIMFITINKFNKLKRISNI